MLWLRLAYKEISNNYRFSLFFILNLSIGLIGFIALDSFKTSIEKHLENNSKSILTADVQISSRFPLTGAETGLAEELFTTPFETSDQITFLSMVAGKGNSRMSQLIGIDTAYPQYGDIVLRNGGSVLANDARQQLVGSDSVWVAHDLMVILDLKIGDSLKIGEKEFVIADEILEDPSNTISATTNFPSIYMGLDQIAETGLIQLGSRISYHRYYKFADAMNLDNLEQDYRDRQQEVFQDSRRVSLTTHQEESEDLGRILGYMNDYLGLIALIALFLAGVGAAYLFRNFFTSRFKDMAVLMCLGATPREAYKMTLVQIVLLGGVSALIASAIAWLALPLLPILFEGFLPRGFSNGMDGSSLVLALFMGTGGSIVCCLPILSKIYDLNPIGLFHENVEPSHSKAGHWQRHALSYAPILLTFWGLAIWQAHSFQVGSIFVASFLVAIFLLGGIAWLILRSCASFTTASTVTRKIALRNLSRNRLGAISCFLAIGLGSLLINLIPQIQKGLQQEITQPTNFTVPDFFMFDIQPDQVEPLQALLKERNYSLSFISPMIRARLDEVNRNAVDRPLDIGDEQLRRRRMLNLTYQDGLKNSESLVAGEMVEGSWDFNSEQLPGISLEENFAERMNLNIGDTMTFDVESVPITGRIMNTRRVDWNSFQPNFFVSFQPGVLDPAPKTFVAAISNVVPEDRLPVQNSIVLALPNISIINVTEIVRRMLEITDQISWAIKVMAYLSIFAGLVVLFSIARYEVKSRFWEINLLKILGASFGDVKSIVQIEFGILGFFAALAGVTMSLAMSYGISYFIFDSLWGFSWGITAFSIVAISALSVLTALVATLSVLKQKPLELLRAV
ncbi:MAG: FtsX-like permease family protein [Pseudomonadales bacterium]|nr:FtsX-like permease family protein [Pseudomonadales bacterium]